MSPRLIAVLPALVLLGCDKDPDLDGDDPWADGGIYGIANIDDDNGNGAPDWEDKDGSDNEHAPFSWDSALAEGADNATLRLELAGDLGGIRVWSDGYVILDEGTTVFEVEHFEQEGLRILVEFAETLTQGAMQATLTDENGDQLGQQRLELIAAPIILNHHLQPAELVVSMSLDQAGGNRAFVEGLEDELGDGFESYDVTKYDYDVWLQDEIEFATMHAPHHTTDLVIDSIRNDNDSGLDDVPEDEFEGPDFVRDTWGKGGANSQDSFGNLEVSPPVTVDGLDYPFGRIYYGYSGNSTMTRPLTDMLEEQLVQDPFTLDVRFLCVGHVDEFQTFVPDSTAPKGYRWIVNDVPMAREFLEGMDPDTRLSKYERDHGYADVGEILDDDELWALNDDVQRDYIDPAIETMKAELGLTEEDIIRIPGIVEEVRGCGGGNVALIPGTANMTVVPDSSGKVKVFMPDPFLRTSTGDDDPFKEEIEALLPAELESYWLDDWNLYHIMLGEVHCGTNVIRTPIANWWESALHLIRGEG